MRIKLNGDDTNDTHCYSFNPRQRRPFHLELGCTTDLNFDRIPVCESTMPSESSWHLN